MRRKGPVYKTQSFARCWKIFGIVPCRPAPTAANEVAYAWAGLEKQGEISQDLLLDERDVLTERGNNTYVMGTSPSDDEKESTTTKALRT